MKILTIYANASGQEINLTKSEVLFNHKLSIPAQDNIANIMGVRHVLRTSTYLGLSSMIGRRKKETFLLLRIVFGRGSNLGGVDLYLRLVMR